METAESMDAFISMVGRSGHIEEEQFNGGFQNMEETGDEEEFSGGGPVRVEKKRRLSVLQVRSLEKNFEVENKLEPERKIQLAKELGLQPRQVAVWFQNRRARWKTKQLERDYGVLKHNYDTLKSSFDVMQRDNQKLSAELSSLKRKLEETGLVKGDACVKNGEKEDSIDAIVDTKPLSRGMVLKQEEEEEEEEQPGLLESKIVKNGFSMFNEKLEGSESDSSDILNDHGSAVAAGGGNNSPHPIDSYNICTTSSLKYSTTHMQDLNDNHHNGPAEDLLEVFRSGNNNNNSIPPRVPPTAAAAANGYNQQQYLRTMDDNNVILPHESESCNFFNNVDDPAAATLPWWEWA